MRIGIDVLALQSPHSRRRGIGRYARGLLENLLSLATTHEFLLYTHEGLPADDLPDAPNASIRQLPLESTRAAAIERLARANPDGLDSLLILSPFEIGTGYAPPARPISGPALLAVVYDLVAIIFQERYLTWAPSAARFYQNFERLRGYDALLAISESTRSDCLRLLGLAENRVVNISGASDPDFFRPDPGGPTADSIAGLQRLGIDRPFLLTVASIDDRKNLWGLLDAARLLPGSIRDSHQIVIACSFKDDDLIRVREAAASRGLGDRLVLTGEVGDETLRSLYQRCACFAAPSFYEGFGLPLLEAMQCGAAVVGGNNSSQPEVIGDAGLLANAHDPADIAAKLASILGNRAFAAELGSRAIARARSFRWETTARRALDAIERANRPRRLRRDRGKPPLAVFSPWPPKASGIADYSIRLVRSLRHHFTIDVYHDSGYEPDLGDLTDDCPSFDHRAFGRRASAIGYRGVLYQMGNSSYHDFMYDSLCRVPGLVTLHDFNLANFHHFHGLAPGRDPAHFATEVAYHLPEQATAILRELPDWTDAAGSVSEAMAERGHHLNRRIFEHAEAVIVHSPWCRAQVAARMPEHLDRTIVIPHGAAPRTLDPARRPAIRARFHLPAEALIVAGFGHLHRTKMNLETVAAFEPLARSDPSALLLFVGRDLTGGAVRDEADRLGLTERVRFLGRPGDDDFADLVAITDIGICLRRPPTNGETSGALLHLLRWGIPTIVNDAGTFADYAEGVVRLVRWESEGIAGLSRSLLELAVGDRATLGAAARAHIARHHDWPIIAARYAEVIEHAAATRTLEVTAHPSSNNVKIKI